MDDIKIFAKNEKELESLIQTIKIYSQGNGMEFWIEKYAMILMKKGKGEKSRRNITAHLGKHQNAWRKINLYWFFKKLPKKYIHV